VKTTPRRPRQQARHQEAAAQPEAKPGDGVNAFVIANAKHKKTGHRRSGKIEWAQVGLQMLRLRNAVPDQISDIRLAELILDELKRDPASPASRDSRWKLSRQTAARAWQILQSDDRYRV
jgi:hypothetical protein